VVDADNQQACVVAEQQQWLLHVQLCKHCNLQSNEDNVRPTTWYTKAAPCLPVTPLLNALNVRFCSVIHSHLCSCFRGYVGTWTSFDHLHPDSSRAADTSTAPAAAATTATAATAAAAGVTTVFDDETVNFRMFRLDDPSTHRIHQVSLQMT
jgi:hypothetical protein